MDIESGIKTVNEQIKKIFNAVSALEIQNKEVAALMGQEEESNPDVLPGGIRSTYGSTETKMYRSKKKKKDRAFIAMLLRESIRQALIQINEIIEYHQNRIEKILKDLEETQGLLWELDDRHGSLEIELKYFQDNGLFDLDENGRLKNSKAEKILAAWERKTGKIIDRSNPVSYEIILNILVDIEENKIKLRHDIENYSAEYEFHKAKLDEAKQIRDDLLSGDPLRTQSALLDLEAFDADSKLLVAENPVFENPDQRIGEVNLDNPNWTPEQTDDEFSFGFPPLKENFSQAVTDNPQPVESNAIKKDIGKKSTLPPKPRG